MFIKTPSHQTSGERPDKARSRASSQSKDEYSGPGEGPDRTRAQKPSSDSASSDYSSQHSRGTSTSYISAIGRRRLSIRDSKGPQGPRPQDPIRRRRNPSASLLHSGKSSIESTHAASQSNSSRGGNRSPGVPNPSKTDTDCDSIDDTGLFVPISFDDFHNNILTEPSLNHFPMPGNRYYEHTSAQSERFRNASNENADNIRIGNRPARGKGEVFKAVDQPVPTNSVPHAPSTVAGTRRQSLSQSKNTYNAATRSSRKSAGPGLLPSQLNARRQSFTARKMSADAAGVVRANAEPSGRLQGKVNSNPRTSKAKSMQPAPRGYCEDPLATPIEPDHARSPSVAARTPIRNASSELPASSSASKRMSVAPPHATGLGARTISPTDARRMERMSTVTLVPPVPYTMPAQTELAQPSSFIPRKSATPSSTRTTPDPTRKSYSSGLSVSSNTNCSSARSCAASLHRLSQNASSSRLPTPKSRSDHAAVVCDEGVPPVPAIPKAYDPPKGETDQPIYLTPRKSSLLLDIGLNKLTHELESDLHLVQDTADFLNGRATKTPEAKYRTIRGANKKSLQSLKLPPLNLLPLGTPMAAKIDALKGREDERNMPHTPSGQLIAMTPSTPLTASRANFLTTRDDDEASYIQPRSSTSHFILSSASITDNSDTLYLSEGSSGKKIADSPYGLSIMPKGNSEFTFISQKASWDYSVKELQPYKLTGPRPQTQTSTRPSNSDRPNELPTPFGLGTTTPQENKTAAPRSQSGSKTPQAAGHSIGRAKLDNIAPPKIPSSATWSDLSSIKSMSPSLKPAYFKTRRQLSISDATGEPLVDNGRESLGPVLSDEPRGSGPSQRRPSKSMPSPVHRILSPSTSSRIADLPPGQDVDPDTIAGDEEMRRLASKRKDFEAAAKSLDSLRSRAEPKERVSPAQALKMADLNIFERGEIIDFKDIYFCGTHSAKKHVGDLSAQTANFGYDDDRGDYNIVIGDHLAYRYEVVDILGKGSFGQVVSCTDHKTGTLVAVKIIRNKKRFHQQALTEVNLLQKLKQWDPERCHNVVHFTQSFYFRGHLCISTELLGMNLYEFIKAHEFKGFSLKLIRRFTRQILSTLVLLNTKSVIHCDLKPENILLVHPMSSEIRVIDFGSSCFENEKVYTYIQSRFYRSPEVILGMSYGLPIDMWSLGCILAELFTGYPLFPGENEQEQLACIMEIFGPPEKHLIEKSSRRKLFFDSLGKPRLTVSSKGRRRRPSTKDLRQTLKCEDEAFLDFITHCLRWDPARRMNPHDALVHEFITGIKRPSRVRRYMSATSSPGKRMNSVSASFAARPLPDPPGTTIKGGSLVRNRDASGQSPVKALAGKRNTASSGAALSTPAKRTISTNVTGSGSALPRISVRSISGKPDFAAAAAATSLVSVLHPLGLSDRRAD